MKSVLVLVFLALMHTWPYWNLSKNLVGSPGDPFAHAAIGEWYCKNVVTGDFHFGGYMAPSGVSVAGNYDSPFPFILTCPFVEMGPQAQFHLFSFLQVILILLSAWAASGVLVRTYSLRWAYVLLTWFCSFYVVRSHMHLTLLSVLWGFQLSLFAVLNYEKSSRRNVIFSFVLLSLSLSGTFQNLTALFLPFAAFAVILLKDLKSYSSSQIKSLLLGISAGMAVFLFLWGPMILFTLSNIDPVFSAVDMREQFSLTLKGLMLPTGTNFLNQYIGAVSEPYERANPIDWVVFTVFAGLLIYKKFKLSRVEKIAIGVAGFYLYISFGPSMPLAEWVYDFYPFKIGRVPSRFAVMTHLILIVLTLTWIEKANWSGKIKRQIGIGLCVWAILWGPAANALWFAPTFEYETLLPKAALAEIKNSSVPGAAVVMIPSAWAAEPIYNFLRLFHGQKITSAYLAYPVYNVEMVKAVASDPFLGEVGCGENAIAFKNGAIMNNPDGLRAHLKKAGFEFAITNKNHLSHTSGCEPLKAWVFQYLKYPWVKVIEENQNFLVTRHL